MSTTDIKKEKKESKTTKRIRITLSVLYFIQVIMTTFPFIWGQANDSTYRQLTAFQIAFQTDGYNTVEEVKLALFFGIFVLFPLVCFFFCVLDKSNIKNFVSIACCVVCVCLITFGIGADIAMGALISLLLYILILFLTTMCIMSTVISKREEQNNKT